ncbi:MAG TPA: SDR family oxidoreductase [Acidimicrobiales bacterium]|nr:SDR family oxidoreductase [Acidimicrobiales bacterium]
MAPPAALAGRRLLVVGASAGIGRGVAVQAVAAGAHVVLTARRAAALDAVTAEAGGGTAVAGDVRDDAARGAVVDAAVAALGEIDAVVYAVGSADLRRLAATDTAVWHATLGANVVAFNQLVRDVLPHLAPGAVIAALSSETAAAPRHGLVPYAASKAALEASLAGWRHEHPGLRCTCVVVGATQPTDFGAGFDAAALDDALASWVRHGALQEESMHTDDVAAVLVATLATALDVPGVALETLVLRSPSPVAGPTWTPAPAPRQGHTG